MSTGNAMGKKMVHFISFDFQFDLCDRSVEIGVEAMDQLLQACHSQTLNLFVESYLRMIQKLLESVDPNLQILATQSVSWEFLRILNLHQNIHLKLFSVCEVLKY